MSHPPLTDRDAVLKAMAEYDEVGRERFLKDHGYREALTIYVEHNGRLYDSKALAGVAYRYQTGEPYDRDGYKGGAPVERLFRKMDFTTIRIPGGVARRTRSSTRPRARRIATPSGTPWARSSTTAICSTMTRCPTAFSYPRGRGRR